MGTWRNHGHDSFSGGRGGFHLCLFFLLVEQMWETECWEGKEEGRETDLNSPTCVGGESGFAPPTDRERSTFNFGIFLGKEKSGKAPNLYYGACAHKLCGQIAIPAIFL